MLSFYLIIGLLVLIAFYPLLRLMMQDASKMTKVSHQWCTHLKRQGEMLTDNALGKRRRPVNYRHSLPLALLLLLAVNLSCYYYSQTLSILNAFQESLRLIPQLQQQDQHHNLTYEQQQQYLIAQRYRLWMEGDKSEQLLELAETARKFGQLSIAHEALQYAYQRDQENITIQQYYALFLLQYSTDKQQKKFALALLTKGLVGKGDNLFLLKVLAFYALQSEKAVLK